MTDSRNRTLERMSRLRVSAILRTDSTERARAAMEAAVEGGFRMIEFTLTIPGALDLVREFAVRDDLLVGAGTVLTPDDADDAIEAGARFLVSPVTDAAVIARARERGAVSVPGTFTPTEMQAAHAAGADLVKIFPAPADLPAFLTQIRGPLPHLRLYPTAGVTGENFLRVLQAGAFGCGFVASLFDPADLAAGRFEAITGRARSIHARLDSL